MKISIGIQFCKKIFCFFLLLTIISCKKHSDDNKSEVDFSSWKKNLPSDCFIRFNKKYDQIFVFDGSVKEKHLIGKLDYENNVVFFESTNFKNLKFPLFDFNLKKNECLKVKYTKNKKHTKNYFLCNQDIFYDKLKKQNVYKFCFKGYNFFGTGTSIVFFVTKNSGIIGWYLINYSSIDGKISISERMSGEVYKEKYNYDNFERFTIK